MKYNKKSKLKFIKYFKAGNLSISKVAHNKQIPKQTLSRWIKLYEKFGESGLENRKSGRKGKFIDQESERLVIDMMKKMKRSAYRMRIDLRKNGYNLSERQIRKIYKRNRL
ncbi:MAG: helix-turn-helix domain containing protein [Nanoarchaeota archaeon]|nr:helix-turn-helix domain containing protein [Nanoarchaeota archaeon]